MPKRAVIDLELDPNDDGGEAREVIEKYKGDASVSFDEMNKRFILTGNNFDALEIVNMLNGGKKKSIFNFSRKKKKRWNATLSEFDHNYNQNNAQESQGDARVLQEPGHNGYGYNNYYNLGRNAYGYNVNYYNPPGYSTQTQYQPGYYNNNSNR